ncbi:PspC domain-containing protein [Flavobacterium sp.]
MNKTVNINIGGLIFHIDEDAYQKLTRYFEAIKRSLSNSSGQDEIMKDIEMRVAELLTERQPSDKHVINNRDVEEVIVVMGQPEDYRIDDDAELPKADTYYAASSRKKLYRDKDRGTIAGVCAGLGHYFGIQSVWIKIAFILLTWAGGTGIIAYFILWIATPKAVTTSEKLEMTGQPVTISSIEKKVREEFDTVSEKFKNADYDKMGNQVRYGAERVGSRIEEVILKILGVFAKVLGALILIFSSMSLFGLIIGMFTLGSTSLIDTPWQRYIDAVNYTDFPIWAFGVISFLAIGIPLFFFLLLGLKLMITNMKSIGSPVKYSLLAIWIFSVAALVFIGIKQSTERAFDGKTVIKEVINLQPNDTLNIKFASNDFFSKDVNHHEDFLFTQDSLKNEVIYSNEVKIFIKKTDKSQTYLQIEKSAEGKSFTEANQRAEKINYTYKIIGNKLILDNYLITEMASKYRNQNVELYLYLPVGTIFKADETVERFDYSDNDFFNSNYSSANYAYKVEGNQIKCINCSGSENEYGDAERLGNDVVADSIKKEVVLNVNGKDIITKETSTTTYGTNEKDTNVRSKSKLQLNKDGILIKIE